MFTTLGIHPCTEYLSLPRPEESRIIHFGFNFWNVYRILLRNDWS